MLGSSLSVSGPNIILNTAVAEILSQYYDKLKHVPADELESAVHKLLQKAISEHKKILFDGNGYTDEWVEEAERRGLANLRSTPEALPHMLDKKNIDLFTKHKIFTEGEVHARYDILLETYSKSIHIEAKTMADMITKDLLPSLLNYMKEISNTALQMNDLCPDLALVSQKEQLKKLSGLYDEIFSLNGKLTADTATAEKIGDALDCANYYHDTILADMETLREKADEAEAYIPNTYLPYPTYDQLLFTL